MSARFICVNPCPSVVNNFLLWLSCPLKDKRCLGRGWTDGLGRAISGGMFSRSPTFKPVLVGLALADMSFRGASRPSFARQLARWSGLLLALVATGAGGAPAASAPWY